ncbi:hypothetical protein ABW19_dt0203520 [Dactylella cylindrospora]|nr:hypothetical protein ABW19_dt0203520 [Dactylella cylindrospora]
MSEVQPLHTNRGSGTSSIGQNGGNASAPPTGPGRPPLNSAGRPDPNLKRRASRAEIDRLASVANMNDTARAFMGGKKRSWMSGGAAGPHAPRINPMKKAKTIPIPAKSNPPPPRVPESAPLLQTGIPKPSATEPVVITIPDTQPDDSQNAPAPTVSQTGAHQTEVSPAVCQTPAVAAVAAVPPTAPTPTPQMSTTNPLPLSPVAETRQATPTVVPSKRPSPTDGSSANMGAPKEALASVSAVGVPGLSNPNGGHKRLRVQTSTSALDITTITPPPSISPVSATTTSVAEGSMRPMPPTASVPSPMTSPQILKASTIDVPKYMPDGTCQMHQVNLLKATIEDHNLLIGEMQRLGQQIKYSTAPNRSLMIRYSRLNKALEQIRNQINGMPVQSPQELVSDIIQQRTSSLQGRTQPSLTTLPPQAQNQPSQPGSVRRVALAPTNMGPPQPQPRLMPAMQPPPQSQILQVQVPQPQLQLPPQAQNQNMSAMGHFRPQIIPIQQQPMTPSPVVPISPGSTNGAQWVAAANMNPNPQMANPFMPPQMAAIAHQPQLRQLAPRQVVPDAPQLILQQRPHLLANAGNPETAAVQSRPWSVPYAEKLRTLLKLPNSAKWESNDSPRVSLLESALKQGDDLFAALHLLFCTSDHPDLKDKYPFIWTDPRNKLGLELLSQLLFANTSLSRRALDIFVQIPVELNLAISGVAGFREDMLEALELLQNIRPIFDTLYSQCVLHNLGSPPQNLMLTTGIKSPSLQKTIAVSLSQMLKHRQPGTQILLHHQAPVSAVQNGSSSRAVMPQLQLTQARPNSSGRNQVATSPNGSSPTMPIERPEFHVFTTDWGGKVPGWKLIAEWRDLPADLQKPGGDTSEYYTFFNKCVTPIVKIESLKTQNIAFSIDQPLPKSSLKGTRAEGTALEVRPVQNGSKLYRLRCVAMKTDLPAEDRFSMWRSLETSWPVTFFAEANEKMNRAIVSNANMTPAAKELLRKRKLHFRRKKRWGKDCATDITDCLEVGNNTVQFMMLGASLQDGNAYYLAVEELEIADYGTLVERITQTQFLSQPRSKEIIVGRLQAAAEAMADDDEIAVVDDTVTVSIVCPMSQRLFDIPVRGKDCKHLDCFDLKSYLTTRTKYESGFAVPDNWKCPICSCECTPPSLIVDGFMQETVTKLRDEQTHNRYEGTKSVIIRADGKWRPNDPPESSTKSVKKEKQVEIIVLDDDD